LYIPELIVPGTWLDLPDPDSARNAQSQLYSLERGLDEAAVALDLFEKAAASSYTRISGDIWRREMDRQSALRAKYKSDDETEAASSLSAEARFQTEMEARFRAEIAAKREDWEAGNLPKEYRNVLPFLYAKAFLYALDGIRKALQKLKQVDGMPAAVRSLVEAFDTALPTLRPVRNSTAHAEERRLGLDRRGDPLPLTAPVLVIESLAGTRFGGTMEDGTEGYVDVSMESLEQARTIVQAILDALSWKQGQQPRHHPSWTGP